MCWDRIGIRMSIWIARLEYRQVDHEIHHRFLMLH